MHLRDVYAQVDVQTILLQLNLRIPSLTLVRRATWTRTHGTSAAAHRSNILDVNEGRSDPLKCVRLEE